MLIDLTFKIEFGRRYRREFVTDFRTDGGSLTVAMRMGDVAVGPTCLVQRIATGVYWSFQFTDALDYTDWEEVNAFGEWQAEFERWRALPDGPEREAARTRSLRRHSDYGIADDLAAVLRYGREFVRSAAPHVLTLRPIDRVDEKWHKSGPYVRSRTGRVCPEPGCVAFSFHKLAPRNTAARGGSWVCRN